MPKGEAGTAALRAPLDAAHLHANTTQRHKPSRETLAAFARTETAPARTACRGRLCRNSRLGGAWGLADQPRFLHSGIEVTRIGAGHIGPEIRLTHENGWICQELTRPIRESAVFWSD